MTISTQLNKTQYTANGVTTSFSFPYKFFNKSNISVIVYNPVTATESIKVQDSDYSITGTITNGIYESGATIVFSVAPALGLRITIIRSVEFTQETNYVENDNFPASAHENALDKNTILSQQLYEMITRVPVLPVSTSITSLTLPLEEPNKLIGWNNEATSLENKESSLLNSLVLPSFTGNAGKPLVVNNTENSLILSSDIQNDIQTNANAISLLATRATILESLLNASVYGQRPQWLSNTTVAMGAMRCMDSLRTSYIQCAASTLNFASTGLNGLDTGSIASNTWYYIYAILNPTTNSTGFLASTSSTSPTLPSGFSKFRLLPLALRTNTGAATLVQFTVLMWGDYPHVVWHEPPVADLFNDAITSTWASVSSSNCTPFFSRQLKAYVAFSIGNSASTFYTRPTGSTSTVGQPMSYTERFGTDWDNKYGSGMLDITLNGSQSFDVRASLSSVLVVVPQGYIVTDVVG